ncbi:hypothetical protein GWI33_014966 [Rhynchophorus ferrugineus]|uniref:Uncharacterized protein n=1 Tax=Rhynchophorus ferrugineus TaxID=354439 RepID=A0A834I6B8_RHYFE|nr:hypothetical protein GWI33_014966 [Rhynchophorus ferrugineus]
METNGESRLRERDVVLVIINGVLANWVKVLVRAGPSDVVTREGRGRGCKKSEVHLGGRSGRFARHFPVNRSLIGRYVYCSASQLCRGRVAIWESS